MSDAGDVTVVWLEKAETRADARLLLEEWAHTRGIRLHLPTLTRPAPTVFDPRIAWQIETELDRTREALAALNVEETEQALTRAEAQIRAHPELPQAAWLLAEVKRAWAARWTRIAPVDTTRAGAALREAEAIGGARILGIGDPQVPSSPEFRVVLSLAGGRGRKLRVRVDGTEISAAPESNGNQLYPLKVSAAEHHVVVAADGETAYAGWVRFVEPANAGSTPTISIPIENGDPCSLAAFLDVKREGTLVRAETVTCARWIAAVPADHHDAVLVAHCEKSLCGTLLEWRSGKTLASSRAPRENRRWPPWGTWAALGAGAAATTVLTLIAAGAFDSPRTEARFVAGGARIE